ncbi:AfsR/SARP family transcriptional regulator [Streptomyces sp. NPDC086091]|uniref:AfsR/SARP family transcriptional regulator n=1 Tax=Streptomyces sp. NPDC086091 TaxID=3365751 RepID=UPI00381FD277
MLGRLEVIASDGSRLDLGALGRALLARLVLADGRPVQRGTLIDELWDERAAKNPVNALQVQVTKLRSAFAEKGEGGRLDMTEGGYRIALTDRDRVDIGEFETSVRQGRDHLRRASYEEAEASLRSGLALWRGPALEDFTERTFTAERTRLEELRLAATEDAVTAGLHLGRAEDLVHELKALVAGHPLRERLRGQLMQALYRSGRQAEALDVFQEGRLLLDDRLGLTPSPELSALQTAILNHDPSLAAPARIPGALGTSPASTPTATPASARSTAAAPSTASHPAPVRGPAAPEGNLPSPPSAFVGRRTTLPKLREEIGRRHLVTLVGPGGVGKTRLLLEALSSPDLADRVTWWIDLVPAGEDGVVAALAATLGLSEGGVTPDQKPLDSLQRVVSYLNERPVILAFDNCEHVLDAVSHVIKQLLESCPSVTIVTTSREPLNTSGETLFTVEPMRVEDAARLFALRASMIDPSFDRDAAHSSEVLSLCRRLDGLPLAIELAAAHVRMLSLPEIDRRLDDRFALLVKGQRTAPVRHRTLRAVLDWSYALLGAPEQRVLGELALRVAGCSIEDAESGGLTGPREEAPDLREETDVFTVLSQLVDKSLLFTVRTSNGTRFHMLETVRQYALERLGAQDCLAAAEQRFIDWALGFERRGHKGMSSQEQAVWRRRVAEEAANLRVATELMIRRDRVVDALRLESTIGIFWYILGREEEGIDRLSRTLDAYDTAMAEAGPREMSEDEEWALCYVFVWLAWLHHVSGRHDMALLYEERYETTWKNARNPDIAVIGPVWEALHARLTAEKDCEGLFVTADRIVADTPFGWDRTALNYAWSTYCLHAGNTDAAREHALTGIELSKQVGDPVTLAVCLTACGDAEEGGGRREAARRLWNEAGDIFQELGARSRWTYRALRLAYLDIGEGRGESAHRRIADMEAVAADLISYDLRAAVMNLRGVVLAAESRFAEAEDAFRAVWSSADAPRNRRAVAGLGLASCPPPDGPGAHAAERDRLLREVAEMTDLLVEPLARRAVHRMLGDMEKWTPSGAGDAYPLHERLSRRPSVLAAFC